MEVSAKERQRAEHLLQSQRIQLHRIKSFSFMNGIIRYRTRMSRQEKINMVREYSFFI